MLLLLCAVTLLGIQAYGIYDAGRMVEAALLDAQPVLARDGGVSETAATLARERLTREGGDPERLAISGSPEGTPYGELVRLHLVYEYPYLLNSLLPWETEETGVLRIEREAVTMSGWQP